MATRNRPALRRDEDEPDVELEVFENPLDPQFPRLPNVVSRRGHRAVKIRVRVGGRTVIPPTARSVRIDAEVVSYSPDRIGRNRHLFRHQVRWGKDYLIRRLNTGHGPTYTFDLVVERDLGDDHIGEGPYDAIVRVTPDPVGGAGSKSRKGSKATANSPATTDDGEANTVIRFISM